MIDVDTFITILYVMVDDCCQSHPEWETARPGPAASLSSSEVLTLALFGQWVNFPSERAFYRYASQRLRAAFPALPTRAQFNRQLRLQGDAITAFGLHLVKVMQAQDCLYDVLDSTAAVTRDARAARCRMAGGASHDWMEQSSGVV
jgi:hypothetical protein